MSGWMTNQSINQSINESNQSIFNDSASAAQLSKN